MSASGGLSLALCGAYKAFVHLRPLTWSHLIAPLSLTRISCVSSAHHHHEISSSTALMQANILSLPALCLRFLALSVHVVCADQACSLSGGSPFCPEKSSAQTGPEACTEGVTGSSALLTLSLFCSLAHTGRNEKLIVAHRQHPIQLYAWVKTWRPYDSHSFLPVPVRLAVAYFIYW